ncbi:hypothetical protein FHW88_006032 [Mucilaginibacter sp. SG538B]|jgi:hypothetical protein|uniref:hypothetical protein n=1 Tax=Mucilaginibacter TaxID=423349 RepID=UPI0015874A47|nr:MULTISPECIES: hypothetical protein [unclassified Mucilaginibacter]NVM67703.1 hypothetical protein [Mucilaginibacter sp. SG538B]
MNKPDSTMGSDLKTFSKVMADCFRPTIEDFFLGVVKRLLYFMLKLMVRRGK